ncbi:MAG: hypothetical protein M1839_003604 [Geoglossum umbratile]|nr:MAG: hypothetical protein M1839_003604 [Geoglossum umbratile]
MFNANLSWKPTEEAQTVGQHRSQKSRHRDGGSRSSGSSTTSGSPEQRPPIRETFSRALKRKIKTPTATSSSSTHNVPPNASTLPHLGPDALGFLFPPRSETDSVYELENAPSVASASGSTDETRDSNTLLSVDGALAPSSRRTSVCSTEVVSEVVFNEVQQLGPDSKISRVTTVTVTTSDNNSEKEERSSGEGSPLQLQLPRKVGSARSLGSPKFGFGSLPRILKPPSPEPKSLNNGDTNTKVSDTAITAQQNKALGKLFELQKDAQQLNHPSNSPSHWKPPADWRARDSPAKEPPETEGYPWDPTPRPSTQSGKPSSSTFRSERGDVLPLSLYPSSRNQTQTTLITPLQIRPTSSDLQCPPLPSPSATTFTRNLRRMEIATPAVLCQHVGEAWDHVVDIAAAATVTDGDGLANMRAEFEFEKRLWVLTALGRLRFRDRLTGGTVEAGMVDKSILNLYGLEADSWFLATKNHRSTVHSYSLNTSTSSAPHPWGRAPPNCRPLTTPLITTTSPYQPSSFDLIISRSLPAILRSTEYPPFLRDCARMLKPGGHLLISFVDPSPKHSGPLMTRWTEGLKLKLEMQFRCTRPSELLPYWLGEVGGWAGGVEIETMDWAAVGNPSGSDQWDELKSVTGRAVYRRLYETYVEPGDGGSARGDCAVWWWEDPLIVEECQALGTTFQLFKYLHQRE